MTPKELKQNRTNHFTIHPDKRELILIFSNCSIIMGNMILLTHEELGC